MLISVLIDFFIGLTPSKDHLRSLIQMSDPLNQTFQENKWLSGLSSSPNSFSFLWALIDVKETAVGSLQLLSWILPAWCNDSMIHCVLRTCAATSKQKKISSPWKGRLLRQIICASQNVRPPESHWKKSGCLVLWHAWEQLIPSVLNIYGYVRSPKPAASCPNGVNNPHYIEPWTELVLIPVF